MENSYSAKIRKITELFHGGKVEQLTIETKKETCSTLGMMKEEGPLIL
jgi:hypothetical protein